MKLNAFSIGSILDLQDMDLLLDSFHPTIPNEYEEEFLQIRREFATKLRTLHGKIRQEAYNNLPELTDDEKIAARESRVSSYRMYRNRTGLALKDALAKVSQYLNEGK